MARSNYSNAKIIDTREYQKRVSTQKRIVFFSVLIVVSLIARFIVKDPEPIKKAVHTNVKVRYLPGMLDNMPVAQRSKLSPEQIAKFLEADENAKKGLSKPAEALALNPFQPPIEMKIARAEEKPILPVAETPEPTKRPRFKPKVEEPRDLTKPMLVFFRSGGVIQVAKASREKDNVNIEVDRSMAAGFPGTMVKEINENAATWTEPVPSGHVKLKPARGITVIVQKEIASRISVRSDL